MPILVKTEPYNDGKPYFFKEEFINESNAFTKYYEAIKKNGYILKIIQQVENMGEYCDLFDDVSKEYGIEHLNLYCEPLPENEESRSILYATKHVKMVNSPAKGRCLVADCGIPKDKALILEQATVLQVNPLCVCAGDNETSLYRCHNCAVACRFFYTCEGCNVCIFCSRACLLNAYNNYHRYECYGLQRHFWTMSDTDYSYLSLRMLLYGKSKGFVTDPVRSCYGNSQNNYPYIHQLESHFNKLPWPKINKILHSAARNLIYLIYKTTFFTQFGEGEYKDDDLHLYVGGMLVKHYCQAETNSVLLKFWNVPIGFGVNVISGTGKAICPTIALLNHSCSPNSTFIIYNGYIVVKTVKAIRKGEEITICYKEVDPLLPFAERQIITEELFHFSCVCSFCDYEKNCLEAPYKCSLCVGGKAKKVDLDDGNSMGYCVKCQKHFNFRNIEENIKISNICQNLYKATYSIEHVTRIAECYANMFPPNSWNLLDVYKLLYEKHVLSEEKPFEALKYGLLSFSILERHISRLHIPLIVAKIRFIIRALNVKLFSDGAMVSQNEYETMKVFASEVLKLKGDLLFYLPEERISFHRDILFRVQQIYQSMRVNR